MLVPLDFMAEAGAPTPQPTERSAIQARARCTRHAATQGVKP